MITLDAHDPDWIRQAERLITHLSGLLGSAVLRLDHVGSTAIPGLISKPTLHIDIVVRESVPLCRVRDRLLSFAYADQGHRFRTDEIQMTRPTGGLTGPGLIQPLPATCSHRLCLCTSASPAPTARRDFRDALRASPDLVRQYAQLKRRLAEEAGDPPDWNHYNFGKTPFVQTVLAGL